MGRRPILGALGLYSSELRRRRLGCSEVPGRYFDVAGQHGAQEFVEAPGDLPSEPSISAGRAFLHRNVEDDGDLAIALSQLGSAHVSAVALVASASNSPKVQSRIRSLSKACSLRSLGCRYLFERGMGSGTVAIFAAEHGAVGDLGHRMEGELSLSRTGMVTDTLVRGGLEPTQRTTARTTVHVRGLGGLPGRPSRVRQDVGVQVPLGHFRSHQRETAGLWRCLSLVQ